MIRPQAAPEDVPRVLRQLIQQRLCVLQVRCIKALGEPAIDRREQIMGFHVLALVTHEPGEADRRPQLEELRALPLGNRDSLAIASLGRGSITDGIKQIAWYPVQQLSFTDPLLT